MASLAPRLSLPYYWRRPLATLRTPLKSRLLLFLELSDWRGPDFCLRWGLLVLSLDLKVCFLPRRKEPEAPLPVTCLSMPFLTRFWTTRLKRQVLWVILYPVTDTAFFKAARDTRLCTPLSATVLRITLDMEGFRRLWVLRLGPVLLSLWLGTCDVLASWSPATTVLEAADAGTSGIAL